MFQHYVGGRRWNFGLMWGSNISRIKSRDVSVLCCVFLLFLFQSCWRTFPSFESPPNGASFSLFWSGWWEFTRLKWYKAQVRLQLQKIKASSKYQDKLFTFGSGAVVVVVVIGTVVLGVVI